MSTFDYSLPAELFCARRARVRNASLTFLRFDTSAEAIKYAIETLDGTLLFGTALEVEGARFEGAEIRNLYDASNYPLVRRK